MPTIVKDPSWMLILPLIHLVFAKCQPFAELKEDLRHGDIKPVWWGIDGIRSEVDKFKKISSNELL